MTTLDFADKEIVSLLQALGAPDPSALSHWLDHGIRRSAWESELGIDWANWAVAQNVGPYLFQRLQAAGSLAILRAEEHATLQTAYYQAVAANIVQRRELGDVLGALVHAGVEAVLLKGTALAYTVYDNPTSRLKGDIDAWVHYEQLAGAVAALEGIGYQPREKTDRPLALVSLVGGEQQMISRSAGSGLIELQWPAFRGEWVRHTTRIDQDAVRRRCLPTTIEAHRMRVMTPEDTLAHLCHHQAISHQFGFPWVRGLLDVHLVVERTNPDWQALVARAHTWRLATVLWTVFGLANRLLGTAIPDEVLGSLAPDPWHCRAIERLRLERMLIEMKRYGYRRQRFVIQLLLIDRGRDMARLIGRGLFPEEEWLRARYGADTPSSLWRARLTHPWKLITAGRA
jgi:hypothetical protein